MLLTLRGTPFLYQGEELGLRRRGRPARARVVDPADRDGCRAPIPWTIEPPHGWDGTEPWLPFPPSPGARSVEAMTADPASIAHLYRRLARAATVVAALQLGDLELLDTPDGVLGYERTARRRDERVTVLINFTATRSQSTDRRRADLEHRRARWARVDGTLGPTKLVGCDGRPLNSGQTGA